MTGGFNENVPARKPRTRIGQVLTELVSESEEQPNGESEREPSLRLELGNAVASAAEKRSSDAEPPEKGRRRARPESDASRLEAGRDRIASLRERLDRAARPPVTSTEPKRAAAAVMEVVQDLRARLETAVQERSEATRALDEAREALAEVQTDLEKERKLRAAIEAQAEERARIAQEAVLEAEALAAERDQVFSELAEQRRLDDEQSELLGEAEAVLERREEERAAAAREVEDLREQLEARAAQLAETEARLESEVQERARLTARCRALESEAAEAKEALEAIEATVNGQERG